MTITIAFAPSRLTWARASSVSGCRGPERGSAARRAQFRLISQTRIAYRASSLSDGSAGGVHAGDRLPWVEGTDNYAPLTSLGWQLHVYGAVAAGLREFAAGAKLPLHEWAWTGAARRAGLARDALYLVRPDGHIGGHRLLDGGAENLGPQGGADPRVGHPSRP